MRVSVTWGALSGRPTIYSRLRDSLGREPTHHELTAAVRDILEDGTRERAAQGKLNHQRKRK